MPEESSDGAWHQVSPADIPGDGRVRTVEVGGKQIALSRCGSQLGALANHRPHQGGPLGEGSIENGWLRCPWHGYDYDPLTGRPPKGFTDAPTASQVQERADGVYVQLPEPVARLRTVADVLVETLVAQGITHVFGMVGHSNLGFADAMRRAEDRGELTFVGIRHEGAASFAASAFGKLTGRPAACFAIAGPGSTNMLTGLYDARLDGAPVIAVSGQVPSNVLGRGAFQDLDLSAVFRDVSAWTATVHAGSDHGDLAALAVKHALDFRGVAHLVLPDEVQIQPSDAPAVGPEGRISDRRVRPSKPALRQAIELIAGARRPVFVAGHGAREAKAQLRDLAERLGAPVLTTFKAKGLVSDAHPLGAGVLGRSGTPVTSWLMNESDLVIAVGASFSNHTGIASYKLDGGFGQYAMEVTTAVKYGIPIKHVLLDNHSLGKIAKEQLAADYPVWHTSLVNPDWSAFAQLCGATGIHVAKREELDDAMQRLFDADGPAMVHIEQDAELL